VPTQLFADKKLLIILASACPDRLADVSQKFLVLFFKKHLLSAMWALLGVLELGGSP
jgi:hypothetical protein